MIVVLRFLKNESELACAKGTRTFFIVSGECETTFVSFGLVWCVVLVLEIIRV